MRAAKPAPKTTSEPLTLAEHARAKARLNPAFKGKKPHFDGLQQVDAVDGWEVALRENPALRGASKVVAHRRPDLAPKPSSGPA